MVGESKEKVLLIRAFFFFPLSFFSKFVVTKHLQIFFIFSEVFFFEFTLLGLAWIGKLHLGEGPLNN
jgi:hypothetical protein